MSTKSNYFNIGARFFRIIENKINHPKKGDCKNFSEQLKCRNELISNLKMILNPTDTKENPAHETCEKCNQSLLEIQGDSKVRQE